MEDVDNKNGFSTSLLTFAALMTFLIMVVGIFGNLLTVIALLKCPKVRNVAAAFIISLCLADLLFCALVLPFSGLRFIEGTWTHGEVLCKIIPFIQYGNIGVSLLCIAMITINRYIMIAHHSAYGKIYQKHWIAVMIIFCWVFAYGMQLPTLFGVWGTFDYDPRLHTCSIMRDINGRSSKTALFITAFIIPCMIIIACYTKIFWVVHKSEMRLKQHANKQNSIPNNLRTNNGELTNPSNIISDSSSSNMEIKTEITTKATRVKDQRELRARRNEWRITKMVLAIFLSFVICYLPITLAKVADKDVTYPALHIFSYIMLYLSACINPIIYVIMNKQYRKAYKTVIMCEPARIFAGFAGKNTAGAGCVSATEKWKDTAFHNNHSRTIVSQMSTTDPIPNTTSSSQTSTPIRTTNNSCSLEMITTSTITDSIKPITTTTATTPTVAPITPIDMNTTNTVTMNVSWKPSTQHNRITLVGGDIILEEEEDTVPTTSYLSSKKTPYYGQNINVIPDEGQESTKLTTKLKM